MWSEYTRTLLECAEECEAMADACHEKFEDAVRAKDSDAETTWLACESTARDLAARFRNRAQPRKEQSK